MNEREIRARYDERAIVVYQAYRQDIALPAIQQQQFVPPFSLNRMTWIKITGTMGEISVGACDEQALTSVVGR